MCWWANCSKSQEKRIIRASLEFSNNGCDRTDLLLQFVRLLVPWSSPLQPTLSILRLRLRLRLLVSSLLLLPTFNRQHQVKLDQYWVLAVGSLSVKQRQTFKLWKIRLLLYSLNYHLSSHYSKTNHQIFYVVVFHFI